MNQKEELGWNNHLKLLHTVLSVGGAAVLNGVSVESRRRRKRSLCCRSATVCDSFHRRAAAESVAAEVNMWRVQ